MPPEPAPTAWTILQALGLLLLVYGPVVALVLVLRRRLRLTPFEGRRLPRSRLLLAAYVGEERARAAIPDLQPEELALPAEPTGISRFEAWALGLQRWGKEADVRALIALGQHALPVWRSRWPEDSRLVAALQAAIDWVRCPTPENYRAAHEAGYVVLCIPDAEHMEEGALDFAPARARNLFQIVAARAGSNSPNHVGVWWGAPLAAELTSEEAVREVIRAALVPWALGEGDPLADVRA